MKFLNIKVFLPLLIIVSLLPIRSSGQTNLTYDEVITLVETLRKQKPAEYAPETTGVMLHDILQGMIDNYRYGAYTANVHYITYRGNRIVRDIYELQEYHGGYTEGLKKRLLQNLTAKRMLLLAETLPDPRERKFLQLLFHTRRSVVPAFITDDGLKSRFGRHGYSVRLAEWRFWVHKHKLITNPTNNLVDVFEEYPPETAATMINIVAQTWFKGSNRIYEDTWTSWASRSLWNAYFQIRQVELAWRSVALKLMSDNRQFLLPSYTKAEFIWSGAPDRVMDLHFTRWTTNDVLTLVRLRDNPYYGTAARKQLQKMGL